MRYEGSACRRRYDYGAASQCDKRCRPWQPVADQGENFSRKSDVADDGPGAIDSKQDHARPRAVMGIVRGLRVRIGALRRSKGPDKL